MPLSLLRIAIAIGVAATLLIGDSASAHGPVVEPPPPTEEFTIWLGNLRREAAENGIANKTLNDALTGIAPIPRIIELDRNQPEFHLTFRQYLSRVAPKGRIAKGRKRLAENRAVLDEIASEFGVPPQMVVALWGIETDFGRITGGFKVVAALATLAYDGRRSKYFRGELLNALKIIDEGHIGAADMVGSWAGAMGQCQFMPSSFLNFAVDRDGDGQKNIWTNRADVLASAANLLRGSGWKPGRTWGRPVKLPDVFDLGVEGLEVQKSLGEWQTLGIRRMDGRNLPRVKNMMASLVMPEGPDGTAFLVYANYRAIMNWNRSHYFALTAGYLADRIAGKNTVIFE